MPLVPFSSPHGPYPVRARLAAILAVAALVLAACAGGGGSDSGDTAGGSEVAPELAPPPSGPPLEPDSTADPADLADGDVGPPLRSTGGRATVSLSDGRVFELEGIRCGLSPDETGRESILFNAARVDESPYLDVSRLDVGSGPIDSVTLYVTEDFETYDLFLEASSLAGNGETFLQLEGGIIRADAVFLQGNSAGFTSPDDEGIRGTVEVRC
ncbi:MAG: hypothetical protein AAGD18_20290 [Actinomycetota bacterium]